MQVRGHIAAALPVLGAGPRHAAAVVLDELWSLGDVARCEVDLHLSSGHRQGDVTANKNKSSNYYSKLLFRKKSNLMQIKFKRRGKNEKIKVSPGLHSQVLRLFPN